MSKVWGVLVGAALLASACGGGTSVSESESSGETAAAEDESASESSSSESASSSGGGSGTFCALAAERESAEDAFNQINIFNPDEVEQAFEENRELLQRAVALAPDEIKDDLETVQRDFEAVFVAFDEANWDASQLGDEPPESPDADAAGDRIDDYVRDACGIDPESNDTDPSDEEIAEMLDESETGNAVVRNALLQFGFDESQAGCLADSISAAEFEGLANGDIPGDILGRFEACGVGPEALAELGGGIPGPVQEDVQEQLGDLPPEAMQVFVDELVKQGLTDDEANCIAESMFSDPDSVGDIIGALTDCDIPLTRMAELGG